VAGALLLAVGVVGLLWPLLGFPRVVAPVVTLVSLKLPPILIAIGAVVVGRSAIALHHEDSYARRILTLGEATLWTGLVLFLLGWSLLMVLSIVDSRGLGIFGVIIWMDCFPAGVALLVAGGLIQIMALKRSKEGRTPL